MYSVTRLSLDDGSAPIPQWVGRGHSGPCVSSGTLDKAALVSCVIVISLPGRADRPSRAASRTRPGLIQGHSHGAQQGVTVKGLAEERDRAGLQGASARLVVAVSGQDDCANVRAAGAQVQEKVETAHARHSQVEHQAAG